MKNLGKLIGLFLFTVLMSSCTREIFTKQELFEGAPYPLTRDWPLSQELAACDDFYGYVCNETIKDFKLPADRSRHIFAFSDPSENILHAKKRFLKLLSERKPNNDRRQELHDYYAACMDKDAGITAEKTYVSQLQEESSVETKEALIALWQNSYWTPKEAIANAFESPNQADPNNKDLVVYSSLMVLPEKAYYQDKKVVADYQKIVEAFFEAIGEEKPKQKAKWVVDFELAFAKAQADITTRRARYSEENNRTREDFLKQYPNLGLEKLLEKVPESVTLRDPWFEGLSAANALIGKLGRDELRAVYLFQNLNWILDDAYPEYFAKNFKFEHEHLGGPQERPERQERCTKAVMSAFSKEIDAELIDVLFPNFPKEKVVAVAEKVRASLLKGLDDNEWLSPEAKVVAKKKLGLAKLSLVSPDNEEQWDFNPELDYDPKQPLENYQKLSMAKTDKMLKEITEPRRRDIWHYGPLTVNAFYTPADNRFVLLQGILFPPFFDPKAPLHVNIGATGMVTGHELGHAVDDKGSKYDDTGALRQWMSEADLKTFKERAKILVDQFDKIGHLGEFTLGENIGDHVGLNAAFNAAFPENKGELKDKQAFFVQFARSWCGVMTPKQREKRLKTDPHALPEARVNEQVVHIDGFYEAFSCTAKNKMYRAPDKRVRIW